MLLSANIDLPKAIFIHGYITVNGQKMSKTLGNVIDPVELVKKYAADPVRHFLLTEIPSLNDGDFTIERFETRYNADLANGLGNLVSRVLTMAENYCNGKVPEISQDPDSHPLRVDENIYNCKKAWADLDKNVEDFRFNDALSAVWRFLGEADKYIDDQKPWQLFKQGKKDELAWVLYGLLDSLCQVAWQIHAFLPETSQKMAQALGIDKLLVDNPDYKDSWINIKPGTRIQNPGPLFPKIKQEKIER